MEIAFTHHAFSFSAVPSVTPLLVFPDDSDWSRYRLTSVTKISVSHNQEIFQHSSYPVTHLLRLVDIERQ